jgi:hypothetical protein
VPVLALIPELASEYQPKNDEERATIEQFMARGRVIVDRWIGKMKRGVPDARPVFIRGGDHYLFMSKEADVRREIHAFISALPAGTQDE